MQSFGRYCKMYERKFYFLFKFMFLKKNGGYEKNLCSFPPPPEKNMHPTPELWQLFSYKGMRGQKKCNTALISASEKHVKHKILQVCSWRPSGSNCRNTVINIGQWDFPLDNGSKMVLRQPKRVPRIAPFHREEVQLIRKNFDFSLYTCINIYLQ